MSNSKGFSTAIYSDFSDPTCIHYSLGTALFARLISSESFTTAIFHGNEIGDGISFHNLYYGHGNVGTAPLPSALPLFATRLAALGCSAGAGNGSLKQRDLIEHLI
jgi:hypothetical protein